MSSFCSCCQAALVPPASRGPHRALLFPWLALPGPHSQRITSPSTSQKIMAMRQWDCLGSPPGSAHPPPHPPCSCRRALCSDSLRMPALPFPRDLALIAVCSLQDLFFLSLLISVSSCSGFSYSSFQNSFKTVSKYPPTASVLHGQTLKRLCIHWHLFS